jgi:thiol-disulfide isomerase/thioredoxin
VKLIISVVALLAIAALAPAESLNGLWDATIQFDDVKIPFSLEFSGQSAQLKASFFNGDERVTSTSTHLEGDTSSFRFDHYATELRLTLSDGVLKGSYGGQRSGVHQVEARPHAEPAAVTGQIPEIAGVWDIPNESPKGEHAWRLIVRQSGADAAAAILRIDGDTGALTGRYQDGKFVLNHFDGSRANILEIAPQADGSLSLALRGARGPAKSLVALRPREARAKGIPEPTDPAEHTRVKDPSQSFRFSFPDVDGKLVSNTDPRFKNKVILVNITGSWCPNCHDEAPYLAELYRKYRALGLEIVALDYEEAEQLTDKTRLRAFIKKYGIEYTYLVGGEPKDLQASLPQAENLNCWPTTFFLGRDGKVRAVHAGFAAAATGEFNGQLKKQITGLVEQLLSENASATTALK